MQQGGVHPQATSSRKGKVKQDKGKRKKTQTGNYYWVGSSRTPLYNNFD